VPIAQLSPVLVAMRHIHTTSLEIKPFRVGARIGPRIRCVSAHIRGILLGGGHSVYDEIMKTLMIAGLSVIFAITLLLGVNYWPDSPGLTGTAAMLVGLALGHVFRKMP